MSQKIHFTPGPSQLYPGVDIMLNNAIEEEICSISHRSGEFKKIYKSAVDGLRKLISLPDDYQIVFTGSATEVWERVLASAVEKKSFHYVNGSFSKKFFQYAQGCGLEASKHDVALGKGFDVSESQIPSDVELIAFTHNETSTGVSVPLDDIYTIRDQFPEAIIAVDVVSSLPHPNIDYSKIDTAFFSVQKCFGLPAGLGVWMVSDRFLDRVEKLKAIGKYSGPHHDILEMVASSKEYQTLETPNVLAIYLLSGVLAKMNQQRVESIREQTSQKAKLLSEFVEQSDMFSFAVEQPEHRSETVIVVNTPYKPDEINSFIEPFGMVVGGGYGSFKDTQLRIANFPAVSIANVEKLIELFKKFEERKGE